MASTLLTAATGAGQSNSIALVDNKTATLIMYTASWTAAEYGDVQISHDGGTTWQDLYIEGSQVRLHSLNRAVTIYGNGLYRVDKEATTAAAGIFASTKDNP